MLLQVSLQDNIIPLLKKMLEQSRLLTTIHRGASVSDAITTAGYNTAVGFQSLSAASDASSLILCLDLSYKEITSGIK